MKTVEPLFKGEKPNILFFLLESWDVDYVDSFGGNDFKVTPFFDSLAARGVKYNNFFAAGQRSLDGIQAALTGVPTIMGVPYIGNGFEISTFSKLGKLAQDSGYYSIFIQSFKRRSYRMDSVSKACGFAEYYGKEDIPVKYPYLNPGSSKYGWDYDTFMFMKEKIENAPKPFLGWMMTGTTHGPFAKFDKKFTRYPHSTDGEGGFLNTLYYSDWSLSQFFKACQDLPWFENTIFIFCTDHAWKNFREYGFRGRFNIPFLIYAPKYFKPESSDTWGSQLDIMPTILQLIGNTKPYATFGESLFEKKTPYVFVNNGQSIGIIEKGGFLSHNLENQLEKGSFGESLPIDYFENLEQKLFSFRQSSFFLLEKQSNFQVR